MVADVEVTASTVREALAEPRSPSSRNLGKGARRRRRCEPFIRIFVGADDIGALSGLDSSVAERDVIAIIPAIAGGRGA